MTVRTHTTAACRECDWTADSDTADREAEKHTKATGHPTATSTKPVSA